MLLRDCPLPLYNITYALLPVASRNDWKLPPANFDYNHVMLPTGTMHHTLLANPPSLDRMLMTLSLFDLHIMAAVVEPT